MDSLNGLISQHCRITFSLEMAPNNNTEEILLHLKQTVNGKYINLTLNHKTGYSKLNLRTINVYMDVTQPRRYMPVLS